MRLQTPKSFAWLFPLCLGIILAVLLAEGLIVFLLHHPSLAQKHPGVFGYTRYIYEGFKKMHIQYSPDCAQYDPNLYYTLKPGTCSVKEPEFAHNYHINSLGVRDDEESLKAPEIVVIGDSFAMGWGVAQEETFPQLIEKATGKKTLNAGVASYGTIRELKMLDRVDTSKMRYLIIQYCTNDCLENLEFYENQNNLPISSMRDYQKEQKSLTRAHAYFPGKYFLEIFLGWFWFNVSMPLKDRVEQFQESSSPPQETPAPNKSCGELLLYTLMQESKKLEGVQVILFPLDLDDSTHSGLTHDFVSALKTETSFPRYLQKLKFVDPTPFLDRNLHYYTLDDHLNAKGHQKIAELLLTALGQVS